MRDGTDRYELARFPLSDMIACAANLRDLVRAATSLDTAAQEVVDHLYERLVDDAGEPALVLARFFRTSEYDDLEPDLQAFARRMAPDVDLAGRRCLVLRATRGAQPAWNEVTASEGHRALPLVSVDAVRSSPMIYQLIRQLGLDTSEVVAPDPSVFIDLAQRTYNVFHIADAHGSPYVPAQDEFVVRHGVRSVLGFGGVLPTGDLFATILFSRVPVDRAVAERFRTVSLGAKAGLIPHAFTEHGEPAELLTQLNAVTELLHTHEHTALDQAVALERATAGLRRLAQAALVINSSIDVDDLLPLICDQARELVPSHQAVVSLSVGDDWSQAITAVSLSDRYEQWRDYDVAPNGSGIYRLVCEQQRPFRLTQAELEAHPAWRAFGEHAADHPPIRGWLAAPLTGRDGRNLGLIQLSDRVAGEFSEEDEAIVVQLAQLASAALENARLAAMVAHEEAARSREEMLAGLSHDMKTPLAVISGLAATFTLDPDASREERVEGYEALGRQAKRLRVLVQRFLDYSALEAGRTLSVSTRPSDLPRVIAGVVALFRDQRDVELDVPDELPKVRADEDRLEQGLANLMSNAIKYSPETHPVRVEVSVDDRQVHVHVVDRGSGIEPGELEHIWAKFRRGSNARGTEGSGLGLYIARAVIEAQGGAITVRSTRQEGSRFTVTLDRADVDAATAAAG